jgi:F0F1-type ATP synthase assembly protein I
MKGERPDDLPAPPVESAGAGKRAVSTRFEIARTAGQVGSLGMSFVLAIVIGAGLGLWLDSHTGWSPVFFIVFFIAGVAAGILNAYRILKGMSR